MIRGIARGLVPRGLRNWLRDPRASTAWARDELLHAAGLDRRVAMRPGWTLTCHPAAWRVGYASHLSDPEQAAELDAFQAECRPGMVLLDVGAHFGLFSLAALAAQPDARAVALDPSPAACRMLRLQAGLNGAGGRLTVIQAAAAARAGAAEFIPVGVIGGGYYSGATAGYGAGERRAVPAVTLDAVAAELGISPTHLKIDVEGFEAQVLSGAAGLLDRTPRPLLFLELHHAMIRERGDDPARTLDYLSARGYQLFDPGPTPVSRSTVLARPITRVIAR